VTPWSHPAAEQRHGGRNQMIRSDFKAALQHAAKAWNISGKMGQKVALDINDPAWLDAFLRANSKG